MLLCDTGPLVAAALSKDPDHRPCVDLFTANHLAGRAIVLPGLVVAEVCYLLARQAGAKAEALFLQSLADGDFVTEEVTSADYQRMAELVEQYADLPLGATDAAVTVSLGIGRTARTGFSDGLDGRSWPEAAWSRP